MDHPSPPQQLPIAARWCLASQRCIDLEVARTPEQQRIGLMQRSIRKDSQLGRAPFGMALLAALQRRFPCKKPKGKDEPPTP